MPTACVHRSRRGPGPAAPAEAEAVPGGGSSPAHASLGSLARLATDTGGRFTEQTNDLSLGYARAQRDLGCVYSVGFYVSDFDEDQVRGVKLFTKRSGLRVLHPSKYVFRSKSARRQSMLQAAWDAPEMFETGVVRAHVFPLRPKSKSTWDAILAVSFPVPLGGRQGRDAQHEFGAVISRGPRVAHRFSRVITLQPDDADVTSAPTITFLEPVTLGPGTYVVTAVNADREVTVPHATRISVEVPEIPRKELFLVGPLLGRPSGPNLVVSGGGELDEDRQGSESAFEPLMVRQLDRPLDLAAFTQACFVSKGGRKVKKAPVADPTISRTLRYRSGEKLGQLDDVTPKLERDGSIYCGTMLDVIPALPDGEYVFEAALRSDADGEGDPVQQVRFAIGRSGQAGDPN